MYGFRIHDLDISVTTTAVHIAFTRLNLQYLHSCSTTHGEGNRFHTFLVHN